MDLENDFEVANRNGLISADASANLATWLDGEFLPPWARESIVELAHGECWEELNDRFYKEIAFGTGGMRGRTIGRIVTAAEAGAMSERGRPEHAAVGSAVLNDFNIIRATIGLFRYCRRYLDAEGHNYETPTLVVAHDVRHFSRHFAELASSTWSRLGGHALLFDGPRSTPELSFSVRFLHATAGIVITASHNPPSDNGYKAYFRDGGQVVAPHDKGIIESVNSVALNESAGFLAKNLDRVVLIPPSVDAAYLRVLRENVIDPTVIERFTPRVVFTPIHGTGGIISVPLMNQFGVEVVVVEEQSDMDPRFPTVDSPNPENAEALHLAVEKAVETGADFVVGTDPDADRMGVGVRNPDGEIELLSGNTIGSLLAEFRIEKLKAAGWLPKEGTQQAALVKTFVTTPLQAAIARHHGVKLIDTLTGFKFIGEKLLDWEDELIHRLLEREGIALDYDHTDPHTRAELLQKYSTFYIFGGEESYGYLASDRVRDKDANAAVIQMCELASSLKERGRTITEYRDELYLRYGYYHESLLNLVYEGETGAESIAKILASYRETPPTSIGGYEITRFTDFGVEEVRDADGKRVPKQDFFVLELSNGYSYAVRGSGTEPKIKFYLFGREPVADAVALPGIKNRTRESLTILRGAIESDARQRAGVAAG